MNLLSELNQISNLTDAQKTVLAIVEFSPTQKQAFAATTGSDKLVYARDSLARLGYISVVNGQIAMTPTGKNAIIQYNLADDTGQPTDDTIALLKTVNDDDVTNQE